MTGWLFIIKQVDVNLLVVKTLGAILTMLTLCGYLIAVSKIESYLNGHIMALAVILLAITMIPTMILFLMLLITLIAVFNIVGVTCCSVIKQLSPTLYLRMSQSWISAKIILAVEIIASVLTIVSVVLGCEGDLPCAKTFLSNSMMNFALASSGILMIMTDCALQYKQDEVF